MRALLLVPLALVACKGDGSKLLTGPEAIVWKSDSDFHVAAEPKMRGQVTFYDGKLNISMWKFPPNMPVQLGDRRMSTADDGSLHIGASLDAMMPSLPLRKDAKLEHHLSLVLQPAGRPSRSLPLPPVDVNGYTLETMLKRAQDGPVRFGSEGARPEGPLRSVIYLHSIDRKVFGPAVTLGEIDGVAVSQRLDEVRGTRQCGGYKDNSGRPMAALTMQLKDTEVVIYDRRNGGPVEKRRFAPKDECPMFVMRSAGQTTVDAYEPTEAIEAWLRDYVQGVRPETVDVAEKK